MLRYIHLQDGEQLPNIGDFRPFKAIVVIENRSSDEWQISASKWLVDSGCLFMMAWGEDCGSWDDTVDHANLEAFDYGDIPGGEDVMTTWHEHDPLEEVFQFAKAWARHPTVEVNNVLIFHVGGEDKQTKLEAMFRNA